MSHQEQKTTMKDVSSIYIGELPNGDFYVGTELPTGGFATDTGVAVEQQNPLSNLPQNITECFGHRMWDLSKTCVACGKHETHGVIVCNPRLFFYFMCGCIRACSEHYDMVSAHFSKPEFNGPIINPCGDYYEIRRCSQCRKNFSAISDSPNSFCDKGCQVNWLDRRFG
jgi:hypothetical protein